MNREATAIRRVLLAPWLAFAAVVLWFMLASQAARGQYFPDDRNSCRSCHIDARNKTDFCELFEATIYERDDKHGRAFLLLRDNPNLVRQILGFDLHEAFDDDRYARLKDAKDDETNRKVAAVKSCLRCHATWPTAADVQSPTQPPVALELGVSCQACHGPGQRWFLAHQLRPYAWRVVTPAAKTALGFTDVRSPVTKAQLCASCHVGSIDEGKLVKHEWYASGHPPLPSFELASFEAQMPVHWKPLAEKKSFALREGSLPRDDVGIAANLRTLQDAGIPNDAIRANYLEANFTDVAAAGRDLSRTKDATVAGASVLRAYVQIVGDYAALAAENKAAWPELALYDCSACHHELRSGLGVNSRPKRSHTPGRPPLATWPTVLAQLAARQAAGHDDVKSRARWSLIEKPLLQLDRATTDRPFGDPAAMRTAAESLSAALAQLAADAANTRFDEAAAKTAIRFLTDPAQYETNDFFTARQAAWATRAIGSDLGVRESDRLFPSGPNDPLALELPSGPERSVVENLARWLGAATRYDPAWFREELKAARARLNVQ
jgi:cytochrome c554/c'-like protein